MKVKKCLSGLTALALVFALTMITPPQAQALTTESSIEIITTGSSGSGGDGSSYSFSNLSADGSLIAFESEATNLIAGKTTSNIGNVFLYDSNRKTTTLVSAGASGNGGNSASYSAVLSADGRKIVFSSFATDLIAGMTTTGDFFSANIYLYDIASATTTLVTKGPTGTGSTGYSPFALISRSGTTIVLESHSADLVTGLTTDIHRNIYLYDVASATMTLITKGSSGIGDNGNSHLQSISADGTKILFQSDATDLIPGTTTNGLFNIFLYDVTSATTRLITTGSSGIGGNNNSREASMTSDGTKIVFSSRATDLIAGKTTNGNLNTFLYDVARATTTLITKGSSGTGGNGDSYFPSISADGTKIAFDSLASDLVTGMTTNSNYDIFLYDTSTATTKLISAGSSGAGGNDRSEWPYISSDGTKIIFYSKATDLVASKTSSRYFDLFCYTLTTYVDLTFDPANGGQTTTRQLVQNTRIAEPSTPVRDGYTFEGWYTSAGARWNFANSITRDMTLTAHWSEAVPLTFTVTFDPDNGMPAFTKEVLDGQTVEKPGDPVRSGYAFSGWYTSTGDQWNFAANVVTADMTLTARWEQLPEGDLTVWFNPENGDPLFTISVPSGSTVSKPSDPTRFGFTFDGWFTSDGKAWDFDTPVTQSMTLSARWTANEEAPSYWWLILLLLLLLIIVVLIFILLYRKKHKDQDDGAEANASDKTADGAEANASDKTADGAEANAADKTADGAEANAADKS